LTNYFDDNFAADGADLYAINCDSVIDAKYNQFKGLYYSDYYVSPQTSFDLTGCISQMTPITQDVYVSTSGDDSNDGLTWDSAFLTIHHALSHIYARESDPIEIHIASGVYSTYSTGEHFPIPMVTWASFSGEDLTTTQIDAEQNGCIFLGYFDNGITITNLTITGGYSGRGGGIYCDNSSLNISNCTISDNTASGAGGIYCYNSILDISNCTISGNSTNGFGGGIHCRCSSSTIINCTITENTAILDGGGIYCSESSPAISNCTISDNTARDAGGIYSSESSPAISNCTISDNVATDFGGGISCYSSSPVITRCAISGNDAYYGGGIYCVDSSPIIGGSPDMSNYFDGNFAADGADLYAINCDSVINATHNHFEGIYYSDYYVTLQCCFDLTNCTSGMTPVTQDVYVSTSGDDSNDGLSWDFAFLTIHHALSRIFATESDPIEIHIASGIYSTSSTGECFPIPMVSWVYFSGDNLKTTQIDAEESSSIFSGHYDNGTNITNLTITGGYSGRGGGIYCCESSPTITNCTFSGNMATSNGGGISCYESSPTITNCTFSGNMATFDGGGIYCCESSPTITNCTFSGNTATSNGGGISCGYYAFPIITNCSMTENTATFYGGAIHCYEHSSLTIENSILWNNSASYGHEIALRINVNLHIAFSDVEGGESHVDIYSYCTVYWGDGMIDADPLFVDGPSGPFYLSHISTGQASDSPCVNSGSDLAENICFDVGDVNICMDKLTTRIDHGSDIGQVDMGYHHRYGLVFPPPTPTVTFTVTPTPTPLILGMKLWLSEDIFTPGDNFELIAIFNNPGSSPLSDQIYVIVLDAYGNYYWFPGWSLEFYYGITNVPVGSTTQQILKFDWPQIEGSADGLFFYAGMLSNDFMNLIGEYGIVSFGWQPG